jgi:hypothetical protein
MPVDPVFELRAVRPRRPVSSDEDLLEDEGDEGSRVRPRSRARRVVARAVGYLLILALFAGTARLAARRPIRDAFLDWTTFGLSDHVRSAEKRIADFVRRWR